MRNFFPDMTEPVHAGRDRSGGAEASSGRRRRWSTYDAACSDGSIWANSPDYVSSGEGGCGQHANGDRRRLARSLPDPGSPPATPEPKSKYAESPGPGRQLIPSSFYVQAQRVRRYLRDRWTTLTMAGFDAIVMARRRAAAEDATTRRLVACCKPGATWASRRSASRRRRPGGMPLGLQFVSPSLRTRSYSA